MELTMSVMVVSWYFTWRHNNTKLSCGSHCTLTEDRTVVKPLSRERNFQAKQTLTEFWSVVCHALDDLNVKAAVFWRG
jgi:hypothetical protein